LLGFYAKFVDIPTEEYHRKKNTNIKNMFKENDFKEAFLSWVIDGAFEYFKTNSLNPPESVRVKQDSYKKSQDTVTVFFQENVIEEGEKSYSDTWVSSAQCYYYLLTEEIKMNRGITIHLGSHSSYLIF
jgi:phage/plasmid-associated DNA primase